MWFTCSFCIINKHFSCFLRVVVDVKTVVQIPLEVDLLLAGTTTSLCVTVAINSVTRACFAHCVGGLTDSSLMSPWCSVFIVRSGFMLAVITLIERIIKSIVPKIFPMSVPNANQRRALCSCWWVSLVSCFWIHLLTMAEGNNSFILSLSQKLI